jgi:hypothetical protein
MYLYDKFDKLHIQPFNIVEIQKNNKVI